MPTFALLGATGTIGGLVLSSILESTDHQVRCFVRSRSKLSQQVAIASRDDIDNRMKVFEGDMTNINVLQDCVQGTDAVFLCAAASFNTPGCRIAQDQAEAIIKAFQIIRSEQPFARLPKLVVLSSAETEAKFREEVPLLVQFFLFRANSYIYNDLIAAEHFLLDHDDLASAIFMKPGGLSHDVPRGHKLTTETHQTFLSFRDLANGMVEAAETAVQGDRWDGKSVSVTSPGGKARVNWSAIPLLLKGVTIHFFPWTYSYLA